MKFYEKVNVGIDKVKETGAALGRGAKQVGCFVSDNSGLVKAIALLLFLSIVFGLGPVETVYKADTIVGYVMDTFQSVVGAFGGQLFGRTEPPVSWQGDVLGTFTYNDNAYDVGKYIYDHLTPSWIDELPTYYTTVLVYPRTYNVTYTKGIRFDIGGFATKRYSQTDMIRLRLSVRNYDEQSYRTYDIYVKYKFNIENDSLTEPLIICADMNAQEFTVNNRYTTIEEFKAINSIGNVLDLDRIVPRSFDNDNFWITDTISIVESDVLPKDVIASYVPTFGDPTNE